MSAAFLDDYFIEPERYELIDRMPDIIWSRRDFFRITGGGLIVALLLGEQVQAQPPRQGGGRGAGPQEISTWLHIGEDSAITVYTGKVEIGQNIRTSLAQVVAEELHAPVKAIKLVMADTSMVPFDMGTFGSQSTRAMGGQLRRAAVAARDVLIDMAAEQSKVERGTLIVAEGKVTGTGGKPSFTFGDLTHGQKLLKVIMPGVPTIKADKWKVAGTSFPKVEGKSFVTGKHHYASDTVRPGMLFGKILRPTVLKAKITSLDTKEAEAMPGVKVVHEGDFVGVVAPTEFAASEALSHIKAEWQSSPQISGDELFKHLKEKAGQGGGNRGGGGRGGGGTQGSIEEGLKDAHKTIKATYTVAYIAHIPLEPRAAVAEWSDGKLTVWTGTQRPFGVRGDLAAALGIPQERIRVIVPDMGSGYGGKHTGEAALEAARLSKAVNKPVKLIWTREEEFNWAYFRPAGVIEITAGVTADGSLTAWDFHNYNSGGSAIQTPYVVANRRTEFHGTDSPLKQGSYRGLAATANTFARECAMDELAGTVHIDPLEFRLKNLKEPRMRAVLEAAAKQFGWGKSKPQQGQGYGIACGTEKGSFVATCAEVEINKEKGDVKVVRAVTAYECGAVVNPDHLKNQIEGAVVMGLGGALYEHIDFDNGKIINGSLTDYRVPRFRDIPILETVLVDRKDLPSEGAGETPIIAIAPAIGNAIFQASGIRLRSMPMVPDGLKTNS